MATTTETYAPAPGDPEFDPIWEKVNETLTSANSWEAETSAPIRALAKARGISAELAAKEILAEALVKHGGKTFTPGSGEPEWLAGEEIDEPPEPTVLRIPPRPTDPYWYDDPNDAQVLDHYIMARRSLGNAMHGALLITGAAGVGKTMSVFQAIKRINAAHGTSINLTVMNCATVTDKGKWFGRREADENGTHYIESDFVAAVEHGDAILLDDLFRLPPDILNAIFGLLDGLEEVHLSDLNKSVKRHPQTVFIVTANVGAQYGGQYRMDWAFRERMSITIERKPPPKDDEIRILTSYTDCDEDGAEALVDIARKSRDMHANGELRNAISTRDLIAAAWMVSSGYNEWTALSYTALPLFDGDANALAGSESDRYKVSQIMDGRLRRG